MSGGEEEEVEIECSVGVKQGDNLGPILFIYLIQAVSTTMDKKWIFATPDFQRHGSKKEGQMKYNPKTAVKNSPSGSRSMWTMRHLCIYREQILKKKQLKVCRRQTVSCLLKCE